MINKFWNWYDNLKEPKRFLVAIFVLCLPMQISSWTLQAPNGEKRLGLFMFLMTIQISIMVSRIYCQIKKRA